MADPLARLSVQQRDGARVVASLSGEVDLSNAAEIESQLTAAILHARALSLDLSSLAYLDSQGLRILHRLADRHAHGTLEVTLVVTPDSVAAGILAISNLDTELAVVMTTPPAEAAND